MSGRKILDGLRDAVEGNFAAVTIAGQRWVLAPGWMPIATAPMNTELLLGWFREWPERAWQCSAGLAGSTKGGWLHGQATHWQPLPEPPVQP